MRAHRVACVSHCEELKSVAAAIPIVALRVSRESPRVFAWRRSTALSNNFSTCIRVRFRSADICAGCGENGKMKHQSDSRLKSLCANSTMCLSIWSPQLGTRSLCSADIKSQCSIFKTVSQPVRKHKRCQYCRESSLISLAGNHGILGTQRTCYQKPCSSL